MKNSFQQSALVTKALGPYKNEISQLKNTHVRSIMMLLTAQQIIDKFEDKLDEKQKEKYEGLKKYVSFFVQKTDKKIDNEKK